MKSYTTYKKIDRPYFNWKELLEIPIIPLAITTTISYGILYLLGVIPTVIVNVVVALIINYHFHGLKNAFSGNTNSPPSRNIPGIVVLLSMLPSFLIILGAQLITAAGAYLIVVYQKTGVFYETYFLLWSLIVFGLPTLYFLIREANYWFTVYFQAYYYNTVPLTLGYDPDLLITIEEISFLNTHKMFKSTVKNSIFSNLNKIDKVPDAASIVEYNKYFYRPAFRKSLAIPKRTNILSITYTSGLEGMRYQKEMAFPYDKLQFEQEKYPANKSKFLRGKKSDPVILNLQKGGILHLFNRFGTLITPCQLRQKPLSLEEKQKVLSNKEISKSAPLQVKGMASGLEDLLANKSLYTRMSLKKRFFNWRLTGTGLEDHGIRVMDVQNYLLDDEKIEINTIEKRPLPLSFEFTYRYDCWLIIHINPEKLIDQMLPAQLNDPDAVFDFNVSVDLQKGEADFKLLYKGAELLFSGWEKEIIAHRWKDAKNNLLKKQQHDQKQGILTEIYGLLEKKQYQKAQEICKKQIQLQPDFAMLYFYEARLLFYTQGYAASYVHESYFIEKTAKEPYALARIYNHYGCLLDEEKRYQEALTYFNKAFATYPDEIIYLANKAEILYKLQEIEWASLYAAECKKAGYNSDIISEILSHETR